MMTLRQTIIINVCCKVFHPAPTPNIRNRHIFFLSARQPAVSSGLIKVSHSCSVWDIVPKHAHIWKLLCSILWLRCATLEKSEHPGGPMHLRAARWLTFTDTARGTLWRSSKCGLYRLSVVRLPCRSRMCITSAREHNESNIHSLPSPKDATWCSSHVWYCAFPTLSLHCVLDSGYPPPDCKPAEWNNSAVWGCLFRDKLWLFESLEPFRKYGF